MNYKTLGLIVLLLALMAITVKVLANIKSEQIKINTDKMSIEKVEEITETVEGVIQTTWNEETKELEIMYEGNETNIQKIKEALSEAGLNSADNESSEEVSVTTPEAMK